MLDNLHLKRRCGHPSELFETNMLMCAFCLGSEQSRLHRFDPEKINFELVAQVVRHIHLQAADVRREG